MLKRSMVQWIKTHKAETALIVIGVLFVGNQALQTVNNYSYGLGKSEMSYSSNDSFGIAPNATSMGRGSTSLPYDQSAPQNNSTDRKIVQDSALSILVKDVKQSQQQIVAKAEMVGGYMVSSTLTYPQESPYAQIILRVPSKSLSEVMEHYRSLGVKVTAESLYGQDVTDQYVDLQSRIDALNKTLSRFEEIRQQASGVSQLVEVQREITNLQTQIDSLKGQQKYLEQTALLSKVTVNLSTDELALPYAPTESFRPAVIFKLAVRSLLGTLRDVASFLIWLGVYSVIWAPILATFYWWRRRINRQNSISEKKAPPIKSTK